MALKKSKTINGVTGEYWQIFSNWYDKNTNKTLSRMRCYVNEIIRDGESGLRNYISMPEFIMARFFNGEKSVAQSYAEWKVSKPATQEDVDKGIATEVGQELNEFADAIDV